MATAQASCMASMALKESKQPLVSTLSLQLNLPPQAEYTCARQDMITLQGVLI